MHNNDELMDGIISTLKQETEKRKHLQGILKRLKKEYKQISLIVKG